MIFRIQSIRNGCGRHVYTQQERPIFAWKVPPLNTVCNPLLYREVGRFHGAKANVHVWRRRGLSHANRCGQGKGVKTAVLLRTSFVESPLSTMQWIVFCHDELPAENVPSVVHDHMTASRKLTQLEFDFIIRENTNTNNNCNC